MLRSYTMYLPKKFTKRNDEEQQQLDVAFRVSLNTKTTHVHFIKFCDDLIWNASYFDESITEPGLAAMSYTIYLVIRVEMLLV